MFWGIWMTWNDIKVSEWLQECLRACLSEWPGRFKQGRKTKWKVEPHEYDSLLPGFHAELGWGVTYAIVLTGADAIPCPESLNSGLTSSLVLVWNGNLGRMSNAVRGVWEGKWWLWHFTSRRNYPQWIWPQLRYLIWPLGYWCFPSKKYF